MTHPGDDITLLDGERGKSRDQIILEDTAKERAGASSRITRFTNEEDYPDIREKKQREAEIRRALTALQERLCDPEYRRLFDKANNSINEAQDALDQAIQENAEHIADLERRAVRLTDGRMVFLCEDGSGQTQDGETVSRAEMARLYVPDNATTLREYEAARTRRSELSGYADRVDSARREVNDHDNPASKDRLRDIDRDMRAMTADIREQATLSANFGITAGTPADTRASRLDTSFSNFAP